MRESSDTKNIAHDKTMWILTIFRIIKMYILKRDTKQKAGECGAQKFSS